MQLIERIRQSYKVRQVRAFGSYGALFILSRFRRIQLRSAISRQPEVHIHFGCGEINDGRFINVDSRPFPHVHLITGSPMIRPFSNNMADSIYACHVFEHISYRRQLAVLRRWLEILKPGGRLMLSVPDFDKLANVYMRSDCEVRSIEPYLMGGQDYAGNYHFAIFNRRHLSRLLEQAGFVRISEWHPRDEVAWPKDHSWDDWVSLNLVGRKPES